jgi:hypothetical protein
LSLLLSYSPGLLLSNSNKGWTSPAGISYWAVVLHFMDAVQFKPVSIALAVRKKEDQTSVELVSLSEIFVSLTLKARATQDILAFWNLWQPSEERFLCHIISDTTAVNPAMVGKLDNDSHYWVQCACHLLQLVVLDALDNVKALLQRHRNIVGSLLLFLMLRRSDFSRNHQNKKANCCCY